jgi:hypothetical protein
MWDIASAGSSTRGAASAVGGEPGGQGHSGGTLPPPESRHQRGYGEKTPRWTPPVKAGS